MKIRIITLTEKGARLAGELKAALIGHDTELCLRGSAQSCSTYANEIVTAYNESLNEICRNAFEQGTALVFISAMGIAVRSIAPYVKDKLQDPPVIVMDELGLHVIPVLSGHMGGANELALEIAEATGAEPVITTATDINGAFPVDIFAKENGLRIANREGIAKVSSAALKGRPVTISIKDYPPQEPVDVVVTDDASYGNMASLRLCPGRYAAGIGCRRGKSFEEIREFAEKMLADAGIEISEIGAVATIDIKANEPGIRALAECWKVPLITYEAAVLEKAPGEFASSDFVKEKVGVDNVSERAAVLAAGPGSQLAVHKKAENGMTFAVARRR